MVTLQRVVIPGYAEARRKETTLRDSAYLGGKEMICGIVVHPISLRRLLWLEHARNGLVGQYRFESENEILAHALQVIYFCTPQFEVPDSPKFSFWSSLRQSIQQQAFFRKVLSAYPAETVIKEVNEWIENALMDAPTGTGNNEVDSPSYASYPTYIVDKFAEAGLPFTFDEIMDMPLRRLWQHWRAAVARINDATLTNPSDMIAVEHIAKGIK